MYVACVCCMHVCVCVGGGHGRGSDLLKLEALTRTAFSHGLVSHVGVAAVSGVAGSNQQQRAARSQGPPAQRPAAPRTCCCCVGCRVSSTSSRPSLPHEYRTCGLSGAKRTPVAPPCDWQQMFWVKDVK
jgi:hypothetical protein